MKLVRRILGAVDPIVLASVALAGVVISILGLVGFDWVSTRFLLVAAVVVLGAVGLHLVQDGLRREQAHAPQPKPVAAFKPSHDGGHRSSSSNGRSCTCAGSAGCT